MLAEPVRSHHTTTKPGVAAAVAVAGEAAMIQRIMQTARQTSRGTWSGSTTLHTINRLYTH